MKLPSWDALQAFSGSESIAGVDEVGRGAWAGPVVAGAVILPFGRELPGLADSKQLSPKRREVMDRLIRREAFAVGLGWVTPQEIDRNGLSWAVRESGLRALAGLLSQVDRIILDGSFNYLPDDPRSMAVIKGDEKIPPVAAASVIAKVARDRYMEALGSSTPGYGYEVHKGYGTARHSEGLARLGPSAHHRLSVAPVRAASR